MRLDKSSWCCCRSLAYAVIGRSTPQGYRYPDPKGPKGKLFALLQASDSAQDTLSGTHIDDERELMADGVSDVALLVPIPRFLHFQTKKHPHRKMFSPPNTFKIPSSSPSPLSPPTIRPPLYRLCHWERHTSRHVFCACHAVAPLYNHDRAVR